MLTLIISFKATYTSTFNRTEDPLGFMHLVKYYMQVCIQNFTCWVK